MTKSSLQRYLRHHFGPSARVLSRPDGFELCAEKNGTRLVIGKGKTVDEAAKCLAAAMMDVHAEIKAAKAAQK